MPVLQPYFLPTAGTPQPVVASRKPRNMNQQDFFTAQTQVPQIPLQSQPQYTDQFSDPTFGSSSFQSASQTREFAPPPQFEATSNTGQYLEAQIANYARRAAPPQLDPGARVKSPDAELVQPSNFKVYYEQLASIDQSSKEMLGTEVARSAFKRMQALQALQNQDVPMFNGMPVGYKNTGGGGVGAAGSGAFGNTPLSGNRNKAREIMQRMANQWGWRGGEWEALVRLIMKESGFNPSAANPTSSARGLFQKMVSIHGPLENSIEGQILWGFNYIKNRYGSPSRALQFHLNNNWY